MIKRNQRLADRDRFCVRGEGRGGKGRAPSSARGSAAKGPRTATVTGCRSCR